MREYELLATQGTRAALALLGRPWVHHTVSRDHVEVRVAGGATVVIGSEPRDLEPLFESFRIAAGPGTPHALTGHDATFPLGAIRVALLEGEEWVRGLDGSAEGTLGRAANVQEAGAPGSRPIAADAVCRVTDGLRIDGPGGETMLVACDWPAYSILVLRDPEEIDHFCAERDHVEIDLAGV